MIRATMITGAPQYRENRIFSRDDPVNQNDELANYRALRDGFRRHGIELATEDIHPPETSVIVFRWNAPRTSWFGLRRDANYLARPDQLSYLLVLEPEGIRSSNTRKDRHGEYNAIFTFVEEMADGERYILYRWAWDLTPNFGSISFEDRRFCTMIASFKRSAHPLELYSERQRAIRWFSEHCPDEFDLYGRGWPPSLRPHLPSAIAEKALAPILRRFVDPLFRANRVYRGPILAKRPVLQQYRFSLSYENMRDVPGYIGEKIWDSLCSGCVPVYRGPSNIDVHVPPEAFIDLRSFDSYDELYRHLSNIGAREFARYREATADFLSSDRVRQFRVETYSDTITRIVVRDLALLESRLATDVEHS